MTEETSQAIDMDEKMALYQKLAAPGEPHRLLAKLEGSWKTRTTHWPVPGQPPVTGEGSCEQKMILDGRFLHQEFKGDMMGVPFIGIGVNGYDNHTGKYVSTWMDSMATGLYYFEGTADAEGRTITQICNYDDPVKGPVKWRSISRFIDDDTHEFEMFSIDQDGNEEKMMELTYIRK